MYLEGALAATLGAQVADVLARAVVGGQQRLRAGHRAQVRQDFLRQLFHLPQKTAINTGVTACSADAEYPLGGTPKDISHQGSD